MPADFWQKIGAAATAVVNSLVSMSNHKVFQHRFQAAHSMKYPPGCKAKSFKRAGRYRTQMEYRIVLKKGLDGYYVAQCLEVPGAISQGRTKAEAIRNAKEALQLVLEVLKEEAKKGEIARVKVHA